MNFSLFQQMVTFVVIVMHDWNVLRKQFWLFSEKQQEEQADEYINVTLFQPFFVYFGFLLFFFKLSFQRGRLCLLYFVEQPKYHFLIHIDLGFFICKMSINFISNTIRINFFFSYFVQNSVFV